MLLLDPPCRLRPRPSAREAGCETADLQAPASMGSAGAKSYKSSDHGSALQEGHALQQALERCHSGQQRREHTLQISSTSPSLSLVTVDEYKVGG